MDELFNQSAAPNQSSAGDDKFTFDDIDVSADGSPILRIFISVVYSVVCAVGLVGNLLVFFLMRVRQGRKRSTINVFITNLAVTDFQFVLTLPFWAVDAAKTWYFGGFLCVSVHVIYTLNLYSSVLILAFISLDRYLAIVHATNSQAKRKLLANRVIYVAVWLPAAILTVPDLVFARVQDVNSSNYWFAEDSMESADSRTICQRIYPRESSLIWTVVFRFQHILVGFVLPGLVILICYCIIISKLSKGARGQVLKRKALKTTVILIICFFGCWLPYCTGIFLDTLIMLDVVRTSCELQQAVETWISITEALAYFHCCLNPILYAFLGVKFNNTARSTLTSSSKSSQKVTLMAKKRGQISSVSTESESSSVLSS